jgi:hypothetical protein
MLDLDHGFVTGGSTAVCILAAGLEGSQAREVEGVRENFLGVGEKKLLTIEIITLYSHAIIGTRNFPQYPDWGGAIDDKLATLNTAKGGK